ncbi:MAG: acyl carrier protein [Leptospiraceae bacterium]|nr:acyl carrier protein [Leptospiraceae bacterium]MBK7056192.1 acyl carrier protein [Leptospiraceae bacterium]MBK9498219.1 acyl carrier protein [Leptospiraceae bacterium]MBP9162757.1 acyl carrier protein [Leptospiraceae bacterium]
MKIRKIKEVRNKEQLIVNLSRKIALTFIILISLVTTSLFPEKDLPNKTDSKATKKIDRLSKKQVREQVYKILVDKLGIEISDLSDTKKFKEDLGVDSIDFPDIILASEKQFNITIPDKVAEKIVTVGQLIDTVHSNMNKLDKK